MNLPEKRIVYFSMEIALDPGMPNYSGGLGTLAGDTLRAAAGQALPMIAVTLLHRQSYFRQKLGRNMWPRPISRKAHLPAYRSELH